MRLAFSRHSYGRPVIGWEADLDRMTVEDCQDFYRSYYAPDRAVICVSGQVAPEKVARVVSKFYGAFKPGGKKAVAPLDEPAQGEERRSVLRLPVQVEKAYCGYKVPDARHPDQVALWVLSSILSTGRSSRFYRALVESGVCIDAGASVNGTKDPGLFYLSFTCQAGKSADEAIAIIDRELETVARDGVSEEELERVRNKLRTEIHAGLATNSAVSRFIGQHELVMGDVRAALKEIELLEGLPAAEVREVAGRYLRNGNRTVVIGRPQ